MAAWASGSPGDSPSTRSSGLCPIGFIDDMRSPETNGQGPSAFRCWNSGGGRSIDRQGASRPVCDRRLLVGAPYVRFDHGPSGLRAEWGGGLLTVPRLKLEEVGSRRIQVEHLGGIPLLRSEQKRSAQLAVSVKVCIIGIRSDCGGVGGPAPRLRFALQRHLAVRLSARPLSSIGRSGSA